MDGSKRESHCKDAHAGKSIEEADVGQAVPRFGRKREQHGDSCHPSQISCCQDRIVQCDAALQLQHRTRRVAHESQDGSNSDEESGLPDLVPQSMWHVINSGEASRVGSAKNDSDDGRRVRQKKGV